MSDNYDEDIVFDEAESAPDKIKQIKKKLKDCDTERLEYLSGWQRAKADLVNARKEHADVVTKTRKLAQEDMLQDMLTILDSFEMAFKNKEAWEAVESNWRAGVESIYTQVKKTLAEYGLERLTVVGEEFDPQIHTSVGTEPVEDDSQVDVILHEVQAGYSVGEKLIRSPRVIIGVSN